MDELIDDAHRQDAARVRQVLSTYERQRDLILLGAYRRGVDPATDDALDRVASVEAFLRQPREERAAFGDTRARLAALFGKSR
jgi:flagellar biosynthesis/type III secretory pathway ATPase